MQSVPEISMIRAEARVRKHFDSNVRLYVNKTLSCYEEACQRRVAQLVRVHPDSVHSPTRLLDVGCGGGFFIDLYLDALPKATGLGIDLSQGMLSTNRPTPRKQTSIGDALCITRKLGEFDVINIDTVMHHLIDSSSYAATLQQITGFLMSLHDVLKPGGVVMIREIYHEYRVVATLGARMLFELSTLKVPKVAEYAFKKIGIQTANAGVCFLTRGQWLALFAAAGFSLLDIEDNPWPGQPYKSYGFRVSGDVHYVLGRTRPQVH